MPWRTLARRILYSLPAEVLADMEQQYNTEEDVREAAGLPPMNREEIRIMAAREMWVVNRTSELRTAGIIRAAAPSARTRMTATPTFSSI